MTALKCASLMWRHEPSWVCLGCLFCTHDTQDCFGSWSLLPGHTVLRPPHLRTRPPTWEGMQMPRGRTVDAMREDCRCHEGGLQTPWGRTADAGPFPWCACFSAGSSLAPIFGRLVCILLHISRCFRKTPRWWYIALTSFLWLRRWAHSIWMKLLLQTQT